MSDYTSLRDLIRLLEIFLPSNLVASHGLLVLATIISILPLYQLHRNQRREPGQRQRTAWYMAMYEIIRSVLMPVDDMEYWPQDVAEETEKYATQILHDLEAIYDDLNVTGDSPTDTIHSLFPRPTTVLCSFRLTCPLCPEDAPLRTLRRQEKLQTVRLLDSNFRWTTAYIAIGHCVSCKADFFPDRIVYKDQTLGQRVQRFECDSNYLRISKHGIWVHRRLAVAQERAIVRFRAGWSNFANYLNEIIDTVGHKPITDRQSQRLFLEHFGRRLLQFHGKNEDEFQCHPNPSSRVLAVALRNVLGADGGVIPSAMEHGCTECTHAKRYYSELILEGAHFEQGEAAMAEAPEIETQNENQVCSIQNTTHLF
jgi:hypothetical protein